MDLQGAQIELDAAREALARVEHCVDDRPAQERYERALNLRNALRREAP